ncbi:hypothetical protein STRAU_2315 [Streptomyces aurantiacus JA 4570]|uniref:Uncharacterized protein n=1 Tax=Streptomyces aurantiacus JA 4570 TaxID=1286094 RepID=S4AT85_9ACTN|nr:hypothetical protein STRAU_2315 [Streptomyces aurantiacus JA 4570]
MAARESAAVTGCRRTGGRRAGGRRRASRRTVRVDRLIRHG